MISKNEPNDEKTIKFCDVEEEIIKANEPKEEGPRNIKNKKELEAKMVDERNNEEEKKTIDDAKKEGEKEMPKEEKKEQLKEEEQGNNKEKKIEEEDLLENEEKKEVDSNENILLKKLKDMEMKIALLQNENFRLKKENEIYKEGFMANKLPIPHFTNNKDEDDEKGKEK